MNEKIIIYQKSTCSKCRATLKILEDSNEKFENINYYDAPFTSEQLHSLCDKGLSVQEMLRSSEPLARRMNLAAQNLSDKE